MAASDNVPTAEKPLASYGASTDGERPVYAVFIPLARGDGYSMICMDARSAGASPNRAMRWPGTISARPPMGC